MVHLPGQKRSDGRWLESSLVSGDWSTNMKPAIRVKYEKVARTGNNNPHPLFAENGACSSHLTASSAWIQHSMCKLRQNHVVRTMNNKNHETLQEQLTAQRNIMHRSSIQPSHSKQQSRMSTCICPWTQNTDKGCYFAVIDAHKVSLVIVLCLAHSFVFWRW